jgi:hypothetical protein
MMTPQSALLLQWEPDMGKVFEEITDNLRAFIEEQHMFFVATAPLAPDGHINLSPKGLDAFRVLSPTQVAYLDMTGSGNETSAHLHENGRITFTFCAFSGPPNIVRLYGTGRTILPDSLEWPEISAHFTLYPATRQIIVADITRVSSSCGFGVPRYDYVGERDQLFRYWDAKGEKQAVPYQDEHNACSIDGLHTPIGERVRQRAAGD